MNAFQCSLVAVEQARLQIVQKSKDDLSTAGFGRSLAFMAAAARAVQDSEDAAAMGVVATQGLRQENTLKVRVKNTFLECVEEENEAEEQLKRRNRTHKTDSAALWALRFWLVADNDGENGPKRHDNNSVAKDIVCTDVVADGRAGVQKSDREASMAKICSDHGDRSDGSESLGDEAMKLGLAFSSLRARHQSENTEEAPVESERVSSFARARHNTRVKTFRPEIASASPSRRLSSDTTVMLKNLPNNLTRALLLELMESFGLAGKFNFVYMPCDFQSRAGLGYAFVNCVSHADAEKLRQNLDGFGHWCVPSNKVCSVRWSRPCQGLQANIERYRNSSVMHESVTDELRPAIFVNGRRLPFPPPTKKVKHPNSGKSARFKCRS